MQVARVSTSLRHGITIDSSTAVGGEASRGVVNRSAIVTAASA